jgi:uncharacterized membrane protein
MGVYRLQAWLPGWTAGVAALLLSGLACSDPGPTAPEAPALAGSASLEVTYEQIDLGIAGEAWALNDKGQIVGHRARGDAFLWENGTLTVLGHLPGASHSSAQDINENGLVVGYSTGASGLRGWVWSRAGGMQALPTRAGEVSEARGVNDAGDIVGRMGSRAVMWRNGSIIDLQTFAAGSSAAWDINENGTVVGTYWGNPGQAFRWTPTEGMTLVMSPAGDPGGEALGINASGQIAGWGLPPGGTGLNDYEAYLSTGGVAQTLGSLGGKGSAAAAVNDLGWVVGRANYLDPLGSRTGDGTSVAFLRRPGESMKRLQGLRLKGTSEAWDINTDGWVVGVYTRSVGNRATLWKAR